MQLRMTTTLAALCVLAACGEPRGEPSPHIQQVLGGADSTAVLSLPGGDTLHLSPEVVAFYRERGFRQAWTDYDEIHERGWDLLEAMEGSLRDGLDPARYRHPLANRMVQEVENDSIDEDREPAQMAQVDMVLSEVFGRYARHLSDGIIDPNAGGMDWRIIPDSLDVGALLRRLAAEEAEPAEILVALRPQVPEYERMMQALERYRGLAAEGGWPTVPEDTPDEVGASGPGVAALRQRLIAEGDAEEARLAQAGAARADVFDEGLKQALQHFQARHAIESDGAVGPATLQELNTSAEERVQQLRLNMDRWRWLPRELGERYILVNVAGFELEVVEQDSVSLAMNVVVGQEGWETPIFRDTMEHIVVNPYWNVPSGIMADEVLPALRRDPGYLARNDMEVLRGDRVVDPGSVDWSAVSASSGYRVRQRPGPQNALGQVKFLFPNADDIYLHDTPAEQYFSRGSRAFSHGCIRVEKPLELARLLLDRVTDRSPEQLDALLARDSEQWISLNQPLPVFILYFTAWVDPDGTVGFYPDIYERDRRLDEEARRVLRMASAGG